MKFPTNPDPWAPGWTTTFDKSTGSATTDTAPFTIPQRGRDRSPKRTSLSDPSPPTSPLAAAVSSLPQLHSHSTQSKIIDLHHHLPAPTSPNAPLPTDPILYLPPLLSPLPQALADRHEHRHEGPSEEELSSFGTRLPNIDPASLALHQALHRFKPLDENYAAKVYAEAFNWEELRLPKDITREWYCVVFRSRRKASSSSLSLYAADREAHEEAVMNGGLVMYWYGVPDETGLNLATCIWQSRRHAIKAISGPKHMMAMRQAKDAYEVYELERWVLSKERGQSGMKLKRWEGGEVGW